METVQIQCGSCKRVMAVSMDHLGAQVHCPHCQTIVQAPTANEASQTGHGNGGDKNREVESIFAAPAATDDIFNSPPSSPKVEMPVERISPTLADCSAEAPLPPMPLPFADEPRDGDYSGSDVADKTGRTAETPATWSESASVIRESHLEPMHGGALPRRLPKSALAPLVLIFLIPYAIIATAVIAYLVLHRPQPFDPLERLPDPKPKDGGPREQVKHDSPLPDKLRTRLRQPLTVGSVQVTPLKIERVKDDLVLNLKIKNLSKDLVFKPISEDFLKYGKAAMSSNRPYTYLAWSGPKLYGGLPEWLHGPPGKEEPFGGEVGPGQEALVRLYTATQYHDAVRRIVGSREPMLWRVQVRRGFVEVHGNPISATAVIGVEFNAQDIERERDS